MVVYSTFFRRLLTVASVVVLLAAADRAPAAQTTGDELSSASIAQKIDVMVPRLMKLHHVPGVSVVGIEDHKIKWTRQFGVCEAGKDRKVRPDTLFEACSMTKPVFAYVVLQLVEQGKLDLDRPLVEYLDEPYLSDEPRHRAITARMVLCHTCGFPNWRKKGKPLRVLFEPGDRFEYSGEGFKYLQHVVEHITGKPLDEHMHNALFGPVGMKNCAVAWNDRVARLAASGHDDQGRVKKSGPRFMEANSAASLFCSPTEYAQFLLEIMRPDRSAAHSLSKKMIDQMLTRQSKVTPRRPIKRRSPATSADVYFGLGWQIDATPSGDRFYHGGTNGNGFRCYNEFDPRRGRGIVLMTNSLSGKRLWEEVIVAVAP